VPVYRCRFYYGPCNNQVRSLYWPGVVPDTTTCGGERYRREPTTELNTIAFVLDAADVLWRAEPIPGQRDLFRAWSRLHSVVNGTVRRQLVRTRQSGRRIRRAVR
jgi:hypothetical protein